MTNMIFRTSFKGLNRFFARLYFVGEAFRWEFPRLHVLLQGHTMLHEQKNGLCERLKKWAESQFFSMSSRWRLGQRKIGPFDAGTVFQTGQGVRGDLSQPSSLKPRIAGHSKMQFCCAKSLWKPWKSFYPQSVEVGIR